MTSKTKNLAMAGGAVAVVSFIGVNVMTAPAPPVTTAGEQPPPETVEQVPPGASAATPGAVPVTGAAAPATPGAAAGAAVDAAGGEPSGAGAVPPGSAPPAGAGRRSYAVGLQELAGLPPDATPGTALELWVTWEPPITRGPRLQKLIGDAVLERTIPGTVPEAPVTVLLSVPAGRVGDLIYADGFGRLSAVLPP